MLLLLQCLNVLESASMSGLVWVLDLYVVIEVYGGVTV